LIPHTHAHPLALVNIAAPEDAALLTRWEAHLHLLQQAGLISIWSELHLAPGTDRVQELQQRIDGAAIVLLFISADFFASSDCCAIMEQALHHAHAGTTHVIPLLLRPVAWQESALGTLTPWPSNEKPILLWNSQDEAWHACIQSLRRLLGRRVAETLSSQHPPKPVDPDWDRMLRRLRRSYKDLLDQSLHGIAWMELGLATRPDAVTNATTLLLKLPQRGERVLAPGASILDAFDEAEGELLILGAPGAGKSTLLLDLASSLVDRALTHDSHPLPIILRLSSWALGRPALAEWMVEQLSRTYDVPRLLSERWVREGRLLPLLDGLDEMEDAARPACIKAINAYHQTHLVPLVVCSRQGEYDAAAIRERLILQNAVIVQPLSTEQIEGYLQATGPSIADIRAALHQRQALRELATTPLMLSVLLQTYRDASTDGLIQKDADLERQVWTDYVTRQVGEKGNDTRYPLEQTRSWLAFLAQQMKVHQQTIFYAEYLQPDWLPTSQQHTVARLATRILSLVIGICVSFLASIFTGSVADETLLQMGVLGGVVGGSLSPSAVERPARCLQSRTVWHLCNAFLLGGLLAASFGLSLHQAEPGAPDSGYFLSDWLRDGSVFGLGSMLSFWAFQVLSDRTSRQRLSVPLKGRLAAWLNMTVSSQKWQAAVVFGIGIGLSTALVEGLRVGLSTALIEGLRVGLRMSVTLVLVRLILDASLRTLRFAERIHWTWSSLFRLEHLRKVAIVTAVIFLYLGLGYGLGAGPGVGLIEGPGFGLGYGLGYGLGAGLSFGLGVGLSYWLVLGLYQGMKQEHLEDRSRLQFNQGIRRSLRNGVLISLISAIIITSMGALSNGLSNGLSRGLGLSLGDWLGNTLGNGGRDFVGPGIWLSYVLSNGLSDGLRVGLIYALLVGLFFGPRMLVAGMVVMWSLSGGPTILRHYVIRCLLARHQTFPFRASTFLDDATTRILLRRVGGGYSFIHRRLQDYFAEAAPLALPKMVVPSTMPSPPTTPVSVRKTEDKKKGFLILLGNVFILLVTVGTIIGVVTTSITDATTPAQIQTSAAATATAQNREGNVTILYPPQGKTPVLDDPLRDNTQGASLFCNDPQNRLFGDSGLVTALQFLHCKARTSALQIWLQCSGKTLSRHWKSNIYNNLDRQVKGHYERTNAKTDIE
jgi:hypothetical protein